MSVTELASNVWRAEARYGFMERPDIRALLKETCERGCPLEWDDVAYYVGHETIVPREDGKGLPKWEELLFAAMERNAMHVSDFFKLPRDSLVEIGRHIAI